MSDLEPGYYRAEQEGTPPAHFRVTEEGGLVLRYPSGQVARGVGATILLREDILPVCEVEEVERGETPFADEE